MASAEPDPTNNAMPKARRAARQWHRWLLAAAGLLCLLIFAALTYLQSSAFQETVRRRLVTALEQATGARVELGGLSLQVSRLEVDLQGLVLHGREGSGEPPLFSVQSVQVAWKLLSVWSLSANLSTVRIWKPNVYVVFDKAGHSNLPTPPRRRQGAGWADQILALQIGRLEVLRGQFRWNESRLPFDFRAEDFRADLGYEAPQDHYSGTLLYRNALLTSRGVAALPSRGELKFHFDSRKAEIESFEGRSAKSRLAVEGTVENFQSPQAQLRYNLALDWSEAEKLFGGAGWEGDLVWRGQASYGEPGWQFAGDAQFRAVENGVAALRGVPWSGRSFVRVRHVSSATGGHQPSPWNADLEKLELIALGGRFTGAGAVHISPFPLTTRLNLDAQRVSFPAVAKALSNATVPLDQLRWAGVVSGPVQASFSGAGQNLVVSADWQVELPPMAPPGFTPVSGTLRGSYEAAQKRVAISGSFLNLPLTRMSGDGWFNDENSQMSLAIQTASYEEVRPLAGLFRKDFAELPLDLHGPAQAAMQWSGGIRSPRFEGNFRAADFTYRNASWDAFSGNLRYESQSGPAPGAGDRFAEIQITSGRLAQRDAVAQFDGRVGLVNGSVADQSLFAVDGTVRNAQLDEVQKLLGTRYPIQGALQASVNASGTLREPRGRGTVEVLRGAAYEEPFDRLTAQWTFQPGGVLSARQILVEKGKAAVRGDVEIGLNTRQYKVSLTGTDLPLETFQTLQKLRLPVEGLAQVKLTGEGTLDRPEVQGQIEVARLRLGAASEGRLLLGIQTRNDRTLLQLNANFFEGELSGSGEVLLQGAFPVSLRLRFENLDLPLVLRPLREAPKGLEGQASGSVLIEGELKNPKVIAVGGEMTRLDATVGEANFRNRQPFRFRYQNDLIQFEQVRLTGPKTDLDVAGTVRLAADPVLNLTATGGMDLALLKTLDARLSSAGQAQLDATLGGTLGKPLWRGRMTFSDGNLQYENFPNGLAHMTGAVVFEGNRARLESLAAESGGGRVELGGFLSYEIQTGLQLQAAATFNGVRLRYPEGISTWLDGRVTLSGAPESSLLSGRLTISRETISPRFDLAQALLGGRRESGAAAWPRFLQNMRLDVEIVSAPDIRLETETAKNLQTNLELRIQGTPEHPAWLGRVGIPQGEIYFAGRHYAVERGEITFLNPFQFEPILSLRVQARIQQYDIMLDFTGPPDRLSVTYRSDPPLPTSDILALLVAGNSRDAALQPSVTGAVPQMGADMLLSQALRSQIGSRLDRIFGAGRIRIDPQISGLGRAASATVAIEQPITDNLTFLYATDVTSSKQQIVQAEWTISPRLAVVAIRDQNGLIGVNLQIKMRFR